MSFYGNSYFYTAETFARFLLNNMGFNVYKTPTVSLNNNDTIIDATARKDGFRIASGNQWIVLEPKSDESGFAIWHNKPATKGDLISIIPSMQKSTNSTGASGAYELDFEDYIKMPVFQYDATGHVSSSGQLKYFKLPTNPMGPIEERMGKIEDEMENIKDTSEKLGEELEKANNNFNEKAAKIEEAIEAAKSAAESASSAEIQAQEAKNAAEEAKNAATKAAEDSYNALASIGSISAQITGILERLDRANIPE